MKQHITVAQLNQLSEKGRNKLRKWWKGIGISETDLVVGKNNLTNEFIWLEAHLNNGGNMMCFPLLSIGQMIEFLDGHDKDYLSQIVSFPEGSECRWVEMEAASAEELCDVFWHAVKEVLEK